MKYRIEIRQNRKWQELVSGTGNEADVKKSARQIAKKFKFTVRALADGKIIYQTSVKKRKKAA